MKHKLLDLGNVSAKFESESDGVFSGYASVFGSVDSYGDTIFKGAYQNTLKNRKRPIQMRWNHYGDVIGKWLEIKEDDTGLWVRGQLTPNHSKAQDVYASLVHEAISGLSIGYHPVKSSENGTGGYDLHEIELIEVSVVESPADLGAQVDSIKGNIEEFTKLKEVEAFLRETGGYSRDVATMLVSRIKSLSHGEREAEEESQRAEILKSIREKAKFYRELGENHARN